MEQFPELEPAIRNRLANLTCPLTLTYLSTPPDHPTSRRSYRCRHQTAHIITDTLYLTALLQTAGFNTQLYSVLDGVIVIFTNPLIMTVLTCFNTCPRFMFRGDLSCPTAGCHNRPLLLGRECPVRQYPETSFVRADLEQPSFRCAGHLWVGVYVARD